MKTPDRAAGERRWQLTVMQTEVEVALLQPDGRQERQEGRRRQEDHSSVMKKYTKLLLGVVAALSSLAFVVYKFRYDRLYHVMQVRLRCYRSAAAWK